MGENSACWDKEALTKKGEVKTSRTGITEPGLQARLRKTNLHQAIPINHKRPARAKGRPAKKKAHDKNTHRRVAVETKVGLPPPEHTDERGWTIIIMHIQEMEWG